MSVDRLAVSASLSHLFRSGSLACRVFGTESLGLKLLAGSGDLKALAYGSQAQPGRHRAAVPFHEGSRDL